MFTLFDLARPACALLGASLGALAGHRLAGAPGAGVGVVAGAPIGHFVGRLAVRAGLRPLQRELEGQSTSELKTALRDERCLTPNLVLLELRRRSEVSPEDLRAVIAMLTSERRRPYGWAALTSAFPELAAKVPGYDPCDSREECTVAAQPLLEEPDPFRPPIATR
jgi:hypothetical protein